ncbi:MAG: hypothetical protein WAM82_24235 [Thermoanaerobaculia bacterium]
MSAKPSATKKGKKAVAAATPPPAPAAPPTAAAVMAPPPKGVKVRMYRTGLGDCFLLAFPKSPTPPDSRDVFYLLVDCGVYFKTPEPNNQTRIQAIVQHIAAATGGVLDLLVITHEHWDHVSAFHASQAQSIFEQKIKLRKLWMAWTENLDNPLAKDLHEGRKAARAALTNALNRMQGLKSQGLAASTEACDLVGNLLDFFGGPVAFGAKKSVQTEEAMLWIKETYGQGKAQFLQPGDGPLALDGVPDSEARVYVLGPPEDPDLIKKYNPSASGDEVYPKALAAAIEASFFAAFGVVPKNADALPGSDDVKEAQRMSLPFDEAYQTPMAQANDNPFFNRYLESDSWRRIDGDWMEAASEFALQLDSATNNTSLAFALEIGPPGAGKVLLFPGDAQVGNWLSWFGKVQIGKRELGKDMVWTAGNGGVTGLKITAEDLLHRTVFYKVGHHGSHNATLRDQGLGLMGRFGGTSDLVAFLPVDEHVARDLAHYGEMPLRSLVKDLAIRTGGRVARNDAGARPKDETSTLAPIPGAPALRLDFLDGEPDDLFFEYTVVP